MNLSLKWKNVNFFLGGQIYKISKGSDAYIFHCIEGFLKMHLRPFYQYPEFQTYLKEQQQCQLPPPYQWAVCRGAVGGQKAEQLTEPAGHVLQLYLPGHHQKEQQKIHEACFRQLQHLLWGELGVNSRNKQKTQKQAKKTTSYISSVALLLLTNSSQLICLPETSDFECFYQNFLPPSPTCMTLYAPGKRWLCVCGCKRESKKKPGAGK